MGIAEALTFDDVTLIPSYSAILPSETDTSVKLSKKIKINIPILSSAMDTVTEYKMALAVASEGGLGVIHRNMSSKKQAEQVLKIKRKKLMVGAACGVNDFERVERLLESKVDLIVIDTAHGHSKKVIMTIKELKKRFKHVNICGGNIATGEAAKALADVGADMVKVGIGPGSICTTRIISGIGVPQLSAILSVKKSIKNYKTTIISDGGIKFSGDLAKAFAAGADAVMIGSLLAGSAETPGKIFRQKGKSYKKFRGMGSIGAMMQGSAGRYFQKNHKDKSKFIPEGVEGRVLYKGPVKNILYQLNGGLKSSMGYLGAKKLREIYLKGKFIKITKAGFYESLVHNVEI